MIEEENRLIGAYHKLKEIYQNDDLILCNPKTYCGYNIQTGKKIKLEVIEIEE